MAEEQDNTISFMAEQFRRVHARFDQVDARLDRLEERVAQVERRITATTHLEQGLVGHLASLHESMDNFKAGMVAMDRRMSAVEARA
jgi:hypothetical protein